MNGAPPKDAIQPCLEAIERMTDDCGMLQHSRLIVPDRLHGYCLDDNARALMLMAEFEKEGLERRRTRRLACIYAAFVGHAWNDDIGRFRNFMAFNRSWVEDEGSQDSFGRAVWALGRTAALSRDMGLQRWAADLIERILAAGDLPTSPRAQAFVTLGLISCRERIPDRAATRRWLEHFGTQLLELLRSSRRDGWTWFETFLAFGSARLPEALLRAGIALERSDMQIEALGALDWLTGIQSAPEGHFRPIGKRSLGVPCSASPAFDQQPLEAWATIDACALAYTVTRDPRWLLESEKAFAWYLGANDAGLPLADACGGCFDGLHEGRASASQGAESILAFQFANLAIHRLRAAARAQKDDPALVPENPPAYQP